jgi:transposase-like protein
MQFDDKNFPKTLSAAIRYFADPDVCVDFVAAMRWPDGAICPHCQGKKVSYLSTRRIWKCMAKDCHKQFSVKTQSVFEDSPVALDKWLTATWMVVNCKNGISSHELHRALGVTQKSAWFMLHRIRVALAGGTWEKLGGEGGGKPVEVDETFVGGDPRKMHKDRRLELVRKRNEIANWLATEKYTNKIPVMGMLDRESRKVRAKVVPNVRRETLQNEILDHIQGGSEIYTDASSSYLGLKAQKYIHETVNHVEEYVRGQVHTQGIENFWSLLKRTLRGTYVSTEPFHLDRYIAEQVFRYNNRATKDNPLDDADRFMLAVSQIYGKRLTYKELTGKDEASPAQS